MFDSAPIRLADLANRAVHLRRQEALGAVARARLARTFDSALATMRLVYQPIVSVQTRRAVAFEALLRSWERAFPGPGALLDAAGVLGRKLDLGRAIRGRAAQALRAHPEATLFVALGAEDLRDAELLAGRSPIGPFAARVVLEVTGPEPGRAEESERAVIALRDQGFRIAVVDFGAAGLAGAAVVRPDVVKLDRSWVPGIEESPSRQKIVRSMAALAADIGAKLLADGVETAAARDVLIDLG